MRARSLAWVALALLASGTRADPDASVAGRVTVALPRLALADVAPAVVYLEAIEAPAPRPATSGAELRQHDARFRPEFLVVSVGQQITVPNDDTIFHNIFSYSRPNDFDLGLYRAGETRSLHFDRPGPVRIYCSIHERMNGLIFVAPSPLFAVPAASGAFLLRGVPPGRYRVHVWSERLPELARELDLRAGEQARLELALGAPAP